MKKNFTKKELEFFEKLLLKKKINILNEKLNDPNNNSSLSANSGDIVDMATTLLEKEMDIMFSETEKNKLKEIEEALERIANKTYGICVDTGELINVERLKAIPEARRSIKAQTMYDRKNNLQKQANRDYNYNI